MHILRNIVIVLLVIISITSCIETINNYTQLPPGMWRGYLILEEEQFIIEEGDEEVLVGHNKVNDKKVPFNFEVVYVEKDKMKIIFRNGEERITIDDIAYGRDKKIAKDSFRINFNTYNSYIHGYYEENGIEGEFVKNNKKEEAIPFRANYGKDHRFTTVNKKPTSDITGKWEVTFQEKDGNSYPAIGEFKQDGNHLLGTFLTESGDYRYLEGTVQGDMGYLSTFDGSHAYLFTMKILDDNKLIGNFRSGRNYKSSWDAIRNDEVTLADPTSITYVVDSISPYDFTFPTSENESITLSDISKPVKIVTIMGTWCPNCKDEMIFLKEINKEFGNEVEIIGAAFENYRTEKEAFDRLRKYSSTLNLDFPLVLAGDIKKRDAIEKFPQLNKIMSYPTLLIFDKNNRIQYIHTGFSGPATSVYDDFKREFKRELREIIEEQN